MILDLLASAIEYGRSRLGMVMEVVTQNRLTRNAYGILGLGGDASQEAIDQAARKMRLWATAKRIPETNWDLPWLGTLERNKSDIEQAVARLADPPTRLRERLMWFCGEPEEFSAGGLNTVQENLRQTNGESTAQREHKLALVELAAAVVQPPAVSPGNVEYGR